MTEDMSEHTTRFEIAKLELHEGDSLVVKCDQILNKNQVDWIADHFKALVPRGTSVIVLGKGMGIEVLRKGDDEPDSSMLP